MNIEGSVAQLIHPERTESSRETLTLVAMCLAVAMTFLEITATVSSLTAIQRDLLVSPTNLVWVASAYTLPVASLVLSAGTLGGRYGRKRVLGIGVGVLMLGSIIVALAPTIGVVLLGQAVAGVGGALILPNSVALLTVTFVDPRRRTEAIGLWAASSGLGLAAGPIIGGVLLGHFSWHIVFLTNVVLGLVTLGLGLPAVTESKHPGQRLDPAGLLLGTLAVFALVFGFIEGGHHGYSSPLIITSFVTSLVAVLLFAVVEARSTSPMLDVRLFRSPSFSAVMVVSGVALFGFTGVTLLLVLFFQRVQGLSALDTGWRVLPEMAAFVVASALTGRLVRRTGFSLLLTSGLALGGIASLALLFEGPTTGYAPVGLMMALFGTGLGFVVASSTAAAMTSVGPAHASMASGALNTFRQVGAVLGTSILGTLLANRTGSDLPTKLSEHSVAVHDRLPVLLAASNGTLNPHTMSAQVRAAVGDAFTSGVHAGLIVNAIVFLLAALLAAVVIRHRVHIDA